MGPAPPPTPRPRPRGRTPARAGLARRGEGSRRAATPGVATMATRRPRGKCCRNVQVREMTWMEVRDAMKAGKDTVLIPTGGVEQNGPYLATGKHNYVLRAT